MPDKLEPLEFCPPLISMLKDREVTGRSGARRPITSLSTVNNLVVLRNLFKQFQPQRTLEVGLAFGGSGLLFTACHRDAGRQPNRQHIAIDPFQSSDWDEAALVTIENAGLQGYLEVRQSMSSVALPQLAAEKAMFDLIYIDGSHLFEDTFVDFYFATRILAHGGLVAFDDSSYPHVRKVIRFILTNFQFAYEPVDVSPFRADQGKSLRYQIAQRIGRTQLAVFRKIGPSERKWDAPFTNF